MSKMAGTCSTPVSTTSRSNPEHRGSTARWNRSSSLRQPTALACGKWLGGAYRDDDVVDCLDGLGGVGFVVQQRSVGGVLGDTVGTVGRQCGHLILRLLPSSGIPGVGGDDDERLAVEVGQRRRLLHRGVRRAGLLDPAGQEGGG